MGILQYDAKGSSQIRLLDLIDIDAIITDLTILNIIETVDQIGNGGLTGSGRSDKGNLLTRLSIQLDIMKHDLIIIISKVHIR